MHLLDDHLSTLIDAMEHANREDGVRSCLRTFSRAAQFQHYSYMRLRGPEMITVSSLLREWQDLYLERD